MSKNNKSKIGFEAITGFGIDGKKNAQAVELAYFDKISISKGKPITKKFAKELIEAKKRKNLNPSDPLYPSEIISVTFSATPLLFLLSQERCAGIRYYYAVKPDGKNTIVLSGVDSNGNDLGVADPSPGLLGSILTDPSPDLTPGPPTGPQTIKSILLEVGGGNTNADFGL